VEVGINHQVTEVVRNPMLKYRGAGLIRAGFIGVVLVALIIAVGLSPKSSRKWGQPRVRYQALFADAGGIATGNDVTVSGIKVGSVTDMSLQRGEVLMTFTVNGNVQLGSASTAHIRTGSLLANGCSPSSPRAAAPYVRWPSSR